MATHDPHHGQPVLHAGQPLASAGGVLLLVHGRGAGAADILGLGARLANRGTDCAPSIDWNGAQGFGRLGRELAPPSFACLAPEAAGHAWYPDSFLSPIERNEPWLSSALALLGRVVAEAEASGVARARIAVAGFSQGACLASEFVARNPARYAALLAFTGGLIGPPGHRFAHTGDLAGTPVLLSSGDPDPHVPWERVEETARVLTRLGAAVTLRRYPGRPHTVGREEIEEARRLLAESGLTP